MAVSLPRSLRRPGPAWVALAFSAVFIALCLPKLGLPGLNKEEALQGAEAVFFLRRGWNGEPGLPVHVGALSTDGWFFHRFPWMTLPYLGALKTYVLAFAFAVFGTGPLVLRATTVFIGAIAVFCATLFVGRRYGLMWAFAAGAWLATDPMLVIMARHDHGPCILGLALKLGGIAALDAGLSASSAPLLFFGGLLFGLALWDKAHFLWFLFGGFCATALWARGRYWRAVPWSAAGFLMGALPWLAYNVLLPFRTFTSQTALDGGKIVGFLSRPESAILSRWSYLLSAMSGSGFATLSGTALPNRRFAGALLCAGALLAAAAFYFRRRDGEKSVDPYFWSTLALAAFVACCLTPMQVYVHHMPMLYPFPQLAFLSLLACGFSGLRSRLWVLPVAAFFAAAVAGNLSLLGNFRASLDHGGGEDWYVGVEDLAAYCARQGGPVVSTLGWFTFPLVVYTQGRILPYEGYGDLDTEEAFRRSLADPPDYFSEPGTLILVSDVENQNPLPGKFVRRLADRTPGRLTSVFAIRYSDGTPWAQVYRVNGPGSS